MPATVPKIIADFPIQTNWVGTGIPFVSEVPEEPPTDCLHYIDLCIVVAANVLIVFILSRPVKPLADLA